MTIRRANMDGSGIIEDLFDTADGLISLYGITLDISAGKIYWTDFGTKKIHRANMDGTGDVEDLVTLSGASCFPSGIALE
jgi:hypothetical protein